MALVIGGEFGATRLLTLDARGRTLAYGRGGGRTGLVSVCPGRQRLAELAYTGPGTTVVIRQTATLRVVRRQRVTLPGQRYAQRLGCEDHSGASVLVFARGPLGDSPAKSALYRLRPGRMEAIWHGAAFDAALASSSVYLSAGARGTKLVRVDLATGRSRELVMLPIGTTGLAVNPAGTLVAGTENRVDRSVQVVRVDLRGRRARVTTVRLPAGQRPGSGRSGYPAAGCSSRRHTKVPPGCSTSRCARARAFAGAALSSAVVGNRLFGTDLSLSLHRADLPSGPQRIARRLPGRTERHRLRGRLRVHLRPNECGRGSDAHTVSSAATRRASGPSDSSDETRTFRFSPTRSYRPRARISGSARTVARCRS